MEAAENVLRAGYRLDRYELLCPIATGGMATVWLARLRGKRGFEKLFAVKTIRTELVEDPRFQEMFLDEARIASGIQHPNVAQILDLGEQRDVLFIVMEWVDGDSLAKIRRLVTKLGGRVPVGLALRILAEACAGLHAAHELRDDHGEPLGIVHRDVSPQNILVSAGGAVKVIDFGIAKAQNRQQGTTRTGIVKGKVQYMAPEQVKKGHTVDRRADIWALGVCLHEIVAGTLPNDGEDDVEVIRRMVSDEPPPRATGLPDSIVRILDKSMVLDPDARFPTAAGMQRALEGAMKELGESATSDDIAVFIRSELPELSEKRRQLVSKAFEQARDRGVPILPSREDVAFAATIVSDRVPGHPAEEAKTIPLTQAKHGPQPSAHEPSSEDSRVRPSAVPEHEPIEIPKRSHAWLWVLLLMVAGGVGAAFEWPAAARRLLGAMGAATAGGPSLDTAPAPPGTPSTSAAVDSTPSVASASPVTSVPVLGALDASRIEPQAPHALFPATALSTVKPTGSARPHLQWPSVSGSSQLPSPSPPPPVAPVPTDEDPNNPYNN
jgi:serine/threonine-protein kinase